MQTHTRFPTKSYTYYANPDKPRQSQVVSALKAVIKGEHEWKKSQNPFGPFLGQLRLTELLRTFQNVHKAPLLERKLCKRLHISAPLYGGDKNKPEDGTLEQFAEPRDGTGIKDVI